MKNTLRIITHLFGVMLAMSVLAWLPGRAGAEAHLSDGATLYVPIYSNVYSGPKKAEYHLAAMLSIRNTDLKHPIVIHQADYYDNDGKLIESYVKADTPLGPLASTNFYIKEYDDRGGTGANFIVRWSSATKVNRPIIQGIMLGMKAGQGVSFLCPGQVITEHDE